MIRKICYLTWSAASSATTGQRISLKLTSLYNKQNNNNGTKETILAISMTFMRFFWSITTCIAGLSDGILANFFVQSLSIEMKFRHWLHVLSWGVVKWRSRVVWIKRCYTCDWFTWISRRVRWLQANTVKENDNRKVDQKKNVNGIRMVYYSTREESKRFSPRVINEVKSTFFPCSIRYFFPDFSWKGRIRMSVKTCVKLTIFNQLTHNYIKNDGVLKLLKKPGLREKKNWKKMMEKNI